MAKAFNLPPSSRVTDMAEATTKARYAIGRNRDLWQAEQEVHEGLGMT
ncbi:hypothetical protein [Synechococcus sp. Tobar12-5m-g]|nr:hypothetical protein [Synechococcus sp. Tobar12-5m-g]